MREDYLLRGNGAVLCPNCSCFVASDIDDRAGLPKAGRLARPQ